MRRPLILLVNGNSRRALTGEMADRARGLLGELAEVEPLTVSSSPPYISNRAEAAEAAGAISREVVSRFERKDRPAPDAVMLACFGEPGLWALREILPAPITGMVEASLAMACQLGRRISILTSGRDWPPQIEELIQVYGLSARVVRITALPDAALSPDRNVWLPALSAAVDEDLKAGEADVTILGGGPLVGRARFLHPPANIRLVDAFDATVWQSLAVAKTCRSREPHQ